MSTNMNKLTPAMKAVVSQIIAIGKQLGASNEVIMAAINIANAESAFDPLANNGASPTSKNYAFGLYEFIPETWNRLWGQFTAANPTNPISSMTAFKAWQSVDPTPQIYVMYAELTKWYAGYDQGLIAKTFKSGGSNYWRVQALDKAGINVRNNFLEYAYLRHNTDPAQIINITNIVFTKANQVATEYLVLTQTGQGASGTGLTCPGQLANSGLAYSEISNAAQTGRFYDNGVLYTKDTKTGHEYWSIPQGKRIKNHLQTIS